MAARTARADAQAAGLADGARSSWHWRNWRKIIGLPVLLVLVFGHLGTAVFGGAPIIPAVLVSALLCWVATKLGVLPNGTATSRGGVNSTDSDDDQ
jgi:hypothetical protein